MIIEFHSCTYFRGDIALYNLEVMVTPGVGIHLIGMPDAQCKETLLRVATAIQYLGYHIPGKKVVINVRKAVPVRVADGMYRPEVCSAFDLPIALGILIASGQVEKPAFLDSQSDYRIWFGGLSLRGEVRLPFCGHLGDWSGTDVAVVETLDWQLRSLANTIYAPACSAINTRITTGVSSLAEIIDAIKKNNL